MFSEISFVRLVLLSCEISVVILLMIFFRNVMLDGLIKSDVMIVSVKSVMLIFVKVFMVFFVLFNIVSFFFCFLW